jgi:N-methylhydantoinase B
MVAQAVTGTAGHINSLATGMKHFLAAYPSRTLKPGDVLITNDPWMTSGQLNDLSVVTPAFRGRKLVGFFGNTCHAIDIGGRGLSADAVEVFEEGLHIPITRLYEEGRANEELMKIIRGNVRAPDEVMGDLFAQVAGNEVGVHHLLSYLEEFDLPDIEDLSREILGRSERAMREAIAAIPDGDYEQTCHTDGYDQPIRIQVRVSVRGDEVTVDFSGSSPQVERGFNVVLNYTAAYSNYALKCAVCPDVPHNEGSFRPVTVTAPEGSIFNPRHPAAVAGRQIAGHYIPTPSSAPRAGAGAPRAGRGRGRHLADHGARAWAVSRSSCLEAAASTPRPARPGPGSAEPCRGPDQPGGGAAHLPGQETLRDRSGTEPMQECYSS